MAEWGRAFQTPKTPTEREQPVASRGLKKEHSEFFAAVRARGILNHMLDGPVKKFEEAHPGMKARWEYFPSSIPRTIEHSTADYGEATFVVAREGLGFHVVDASELGESSDSEQKKGPVRVGDLILMAAPTEIVLAIEESDARAAMEDFKLPVEGYRDYLRGIKAKLPDGSEQRAEPVGDVKTHQEVLSAAPGLVGDQHETA
jgi:hypothetical protein